MDCRKCGQRLTSWLQCQDRLCVSCFDEKVQKDMDTGRINKKPNECSKCGHGSYVTCYAGYCDDCESDTDNYGYY